MRMVAEEVPFREIAARLGLSAETVVTHRANLMKKLGFYSKIELVKYAGFFVLI